MRFVTIAAGRHAIGSRFTELLPAGVVSREMLDLRFSPARDVVLDAFEIVTTPVSLESLVGDPYDLELDATLEAVCAHVEQRLAIDGLRLPTEDELEAAAGGSLFPWGTMIPDGIPYGDETTFVDHHRPQASGLMLNDDPYRIELTRYALKLGDGGAVICGGDPWPMAWLPLSPSFRLTDADMVDCFPETLEATFVRPVKLRR